MREHNEYLLDTDDLELRRLGCAMLDLARPGSAVRQWPRTFFNNNPAAWFASPPMVEVVGVKR